MDMAYPLFMRFCFLTWVPPVQFGICFELQFYTRMENHEFVSSTGSESTELAKAGDDDGLDDAVNADSDDNYDNEGIAMQ